MKFWAVLGSRGCREKKPLPTAISMQLFGDGFFNFLWAIFFKNPFAYKKLKKTPQKIAYLWHSGVFFFLSKTAQNFISVLY